MLDVKRGFKRKTIEQTIRRKMKNWIASIEDETLRTAVKDDYIVTGGAIASMLLGDLPNDFDVYFRTPGVAEKVAQYYLEKRVKKDPVDPKISRVYAIAEENRVRIYIKSAGIVTDDTELEDYQYFEQLSPREVAEYFDIKKEGKSEKYSVAMITGNAISLHNDVQLIFRFVGAPEEIHKNYDFAHCTNWFTENDGLVLQQSALEAIMARELKYVGSLYPICSVFRIRKFLNRGWTINAGEILKICWDVSKLELNDINVLQDQLVGVDAAYWQEVLSILQKESVKQIDRTYLFETINRVFEDIEEHELNVDEDKS